jgi:hypothetical protein
MNPSRPRAILVPMGRTFLFVSASERQAAADAVQGTPARIDLAVTSPTDLARETAAYAVDGRWVHTIDEPLLASRAAAESGADVLARLARAMRGLTAYEAQALLVVLESLDLLGAAIFALDEAGLMRCADDLEQLLPRP